MRIALTTLVVTTLLAAAVAGATTPSIVPGSKDAVIGSVAVAADGTLAVAWSPASVAIRRPGRPWSRVHGAAPHFGASGMKIVFDKRGRLTAAWVESSSRPGPTIRGPFKVRVSSWTSRSGWSNPQTLGHSGHFLGANVAITANDAGDTLVSWRGVFRNTRHQLRDAVAS